MRLVRALSFSLRNCHQSVIQLAERPLLPGVGHQLSDDIRLVVTHRAGPPGGLQAADCRYPNGSTV
ncbi:MAG: hypothetical protein QOK26_756, partial [Pseudonocardiales bacterium]|nr:hypothetical protein [Pseudonocardiales bacterium]